MWWHIPAGAQHPPLAAHLVYGCGTDGRQSAHTAVFFFVAGNLPRDAAGASLGDLGGGARSRRAKNFFLLKSWGLQMVDVCAMALDFPTGLFFFFRSSEHQMILDTIRMKKSIAKSGKFLKTE